MPGAMAVAARRRAIALTMLGFVLLPPDRWFGVDKLKHFLVSALVHSASYTASRAVGMNRSNANVAAGVSTGTIGILRV